MPKTLIEVDLSQSPYQNEAIHNRWHPDIPIIAWVKPGDDFIVQTYDWTGGFIKNNESADDVRDIDLTIVHFLSGPIGVEGAEPGDLLVVDLLDVGALPESLWGFNGFFSKKNGGGFLTDQFPTGAEIHLGYFRSLYPLAARAGRKIRGPDPSGPDRLPAGSEAARHLECARTGLDRHRSESRSAAGGTAVRRNRSLWNRQGRRAAKVAAEGARTVPPREHGGNCDIKDLSRGSKIYFPVYVKGGGLSMGDLHFSQGDGEITFCGAIEMAGWLHLKVEIIKDGMAKYGIKNPIFKPSPIDAELQRLSDLRGHLGRRAGQAALPGRARGVSPSLPQRHRISDQVRLFASAGLCHPGHRAGSGPHIRRRRYSKCLRHAVAADRHFRLRRDAGRRGADQARHGRGQHSDVAGQIIRA